MKKKWLMPLLLAGTLLLPIPARACTLFGAAGSDYVDGGGTLLVKNRDWTPQEQTVRLVTSGRYHFYGLYAGTAEKKTFKGGVNDQGLGVVLASASSIPRKVRAEMPYHSGLRDILANCATVDEALQRTEFLTGPKFLMLADRQKLVYVEVAPDGKVNVQEVQQGTLAHTNHYLAPEFQSYNQLKGVSSHTRYDRIKSLLQAGQPFTLDRFLEFSADRHDGPDNSIWRDGSTDKKEQTLGAIAIRIPETGQPEIYIKYRQHPDEQGHEQIVRMTVE